MSTLREGSGPVPVPVLFAHLVDDASLLMPRAAAPPVAEVARGYLAARDGDYGGLIGRLVCPVSRLPELVIELARLTPPAPVDLSLVVDTGLGAVPKALSLVLSRDNLLTPCAVETAAPNDLDSVWLERVSEFVPEDVLAVVEPRRPLNGETGPWLDAVRRVAEHGCSPKLRCGGTRASDVPSSAEVAAFLAAADSAPAGFTASLGLRRAVRHQDERTGGVEIGLLNLIAAAARALVHGDVAAAVEENDPQVLIAEIGKLSDMGAGSVRGLLARCGTDTTVQAAYELAALGMY